MLHRAQLPHLFIHITMTVQAAFIQAAERVISPSKKNTRIKISILHHCGRFADDIDALNFHAKQLLGIIQNTLPCKNPTTASVHIKRVKLHKHIKSSSSSIFLWFSEKQEVTPHMSKHLAACPSWPFFCFYLPKFC